MKKSYFLMAAAAAMFAACSESEVLNEVQVPNDAQAIGFSTYSNKATRAENNKEPYSLKLEDHHTTFNVWAGKKVDDATQAVYAAGGTVTFKTDKWVANPLKYWDKIATEYYFYAGAPALNSWEFNMSEANNYATGYLKYEDFTLQGENIADGTKNQYITWIENRSKNDVDLMIAAPKIVGRGFYNVTSPTVPGLVEMQFNHILSRLNIRVKKGANIASNQKLELKSLTVYGLKNKGDFNENNAVADQTAKIDRWEDRGVDGKYELTAATTAEITTDPVYTHQYLIIPQPIGILSIDANGKTPNMGDQPYFKIEYSIDGETYYAYHNLAAAFNANTLNFNEGWQNTLTITINPNVIEFDATVSEWGEYVSREKELE